MLFTLRKHWKKSTFGFCALAYGLNYGSQRYREYLVRRESFLEAKKYGDKFISPLDKPRRLYIVLNPAANNRKSKKLFQKNVAPLFYLAGIDVTYIQSDYEGHAKTVVNYFDPTIDGIVVAGGNGTMQEIVTGIMRQDDKNPVKTIPVGIIPLGEHDNALFKRLFGSDVVNVRAMCNAALTILEGNCKSVDVVEVKTDRKPVYALNSVHIGLHQQVKEKLDDGKYWVLGPLRKYFACGWKTLKNWPPIENAVTFSCDKCQPYKTSRTNESSLLNKAACSNDNVEETSKYICESEISTSGLSIWLNQEDLIENKPSFLVQFNNDEMSKTDFIQHGTQWITNHYKHTHADHMKTMLCEELSVTPALIEGLNFDIDGEIFDGRPIHLSIHSKKLNMFVPKNR